jgi:hypothetical protein
MACRTRSSVQLAVRASAGRIIPRARKPVRAKPQERTNHIREMLAVRNELIDSGMNETVADAVLRNFSLYEATYATKKDLELLSSTVNSKLDILSTKLDSTVELLSSKLESESYKLDAKLKIWFFGAVALSCITAAGSATALGSLITPFIH